MADVRNLLDRVDSALTRAAELLDTSVTVESDDRTIMAFYRVVLDGNLEANTAVANRVLELAQLLNVQDNYEQFDLEEIPRLLKKLIELEPYNLEYYESLALYYDVVLDQNAEGRAILEEGIRKSEEKLEHSRNLLRRM